MYATKKLNKQELKLNISFILLEFRQEYDHYKYAHFPFLIRGNIHNMLIN